MSNVHPTDQHIKLIISCIFWFFKNLFPWYPFLPSWNFSKNRAPTTKTWPASDLHTSHHRPPGQERKGTALEKGARSLSSHILSDSYARADARLKLPLNFWSSHPGSCVSLSYPLIIGIMKTPSWWEFRFFMKRMARNDLHDPTDFSFFGNSAFFQVNIIYFSWFWAEVNPNTFQYI